ncbi:MAG: flagellar biosynthetic protein FliR [Thermodesulfobacteriota bacterium]
MDFVDMLLKNAPAFIFVLARTSSILLLFPFYRFVFIPMRVKMALVGIIAITLVPFVGAVPMPAGVLELALGLGREILIGFTIGLTTNFIFTGVEFAGHIMGYQMGLAMANVYDPASAAQISILGRLTGLMAMLVFLSANGHLLIIMTIKKSFDIIPPYGFHLSEGLGEGVLTLSREIFTIGIRLAAPVMAVVFFLNLTLGILSKAVPQLNMFVVGFAIIIAAGFVVLLLTLPSMQGAMDKAFAGMWQGVYGLLRVM